jgi:hypothetical protein
VKPTYQITRYGKTSVPDFVTGDYRPNKTSVNSETARTEVFPSSFPFPFPFLFLLLVYRSFKP